MKSGWKIIRSILLDPKNPERQGNDGTILNGHVFLTKGIIVIAENV